MRDPELVVVVPSRGRPHNIGSVVRAWQETDAFTDAALLIALDGDDPVHAQNRATCEGMRADQPDLHGRLLDLTFAEWQPMVAKLNAAAAAAGPGVRAVGYAGDDHLPRSRGWAGRYLAELDRLRTGIVYGNDLHRGQQLPTQWAMTTDIVHVLGRMVPAPVEHQFCDRSVLDLGQALGRIRYLPDVIIEHMHPAADKAGWDDGYLAVNRKAQFLADRARYEQWRAEQLPADVTAVQAVAR